MGDAEEQLKWTRKHFWTASHFVNQHTSVQEFLPHRLNFNKALAVGQAILDLSKTHMASFYYKVVKTILGDRVGVIYTDTDSLILKIFSHGK